MLRVGERLGEKSQKTLMKVTECYGTSGSEGGRMNHDQKRDVNNNDSRALTEFMPQTM